MNYLATSVDLQTGWLPVFDRRPCSTDGRRRSNFCALSKDRLLIQSGGSVELYAPNRDRLTPVVAQHELPVSPQVRDGLMRLQHLHRVATVLKLQTLKPRGAILNSSISFLRSSLPLRSEAPLASASSSPKGYYLKESGVARRGVPPRYGRQNGFAFGGCLSRLDAVGQLLSSSGRVG